MIPESPRDQATYLEVEAWESIRRAVVELEPSLEASREEIRRRHWQAFLPRDRAAVALATIHDQDPHSPATRRRFRNLLREFERDGLIPSANDLTAYTREEPQVVHEELSDAQRKAIAQTLNWIMSEQFIREVSNASGPLGALNLVERRARNLKGNRAARFLRDIGYPMAVPDKAKRRWLHRFGLTDSSKDTRKNRESALRCLLEISNRTGTELSELDLILTAFTGGNGMSSSPGSLCAQKPLCEECPLYEKCAYARFLESHKGLENKREKRNLTTAFLPEDRPREKLSRQGAGSLTNAELLAILLRTGSGKEHAVELANRILRDAGSLDRLSRFSISEMTQLPGLGPVKAITIKAALELARRVAEVPSNELPPVSGARDVFDYLRGFMLDKRKEVFVCLLLNTKNRIMRRVVVSEGTLNQSLVHPREAFQEALKDSAAGVIFAHNHPSGDPKPSRDDLAITQRLVKAGDIVGIKVFDHVIIGRTSYYSFADEGKL